jgi:hypothetical protein
VFAVERLRHYSPDLAIPQVKELTSLFKGSFPAREGSEMPPKSEDEGGGVPPGLKWRRLLRLMRKVVKSLAVLSSMVRLLIELGKLVFGHR